MKENKIHVVFIIDECSSMYGSDSDFIGGFNKTIDEQKAVENGECIVSYFKFSDNVTQVFLGKDVNEVKPLKKYDSCSPVWGSISSVSISSSGYYHFNEIQFDNDSTYVYSPNGCTAMNDGIGTAIDKVGKWLADMPEEERPSKNLIIIMTDGEENVSKKYTLKQVQEMIKHQTEKYNWTFVYMGMDITSKDTADNLGIKTRSFSSKTYEDTYKNYSNVSASLTAYRVANDGCAVNAMMDVLSSSLQEMTDTYEKKLNIKIE